MRVRGLPTRVPRIFKVEAGSPMVEPPPPPPPSWTLDAPLRPPLGAQCGFCVNNAHTSNITSEKNTVSKLIMLGANSAEIFPSVCDLLMCLGLVVVPGTSRFFLDRAAGSLVKSQDPFPEESHRPCVPPDAKVDKSCALDM